LVEEDVVERIAGDYETSDLPERDKVLLRFVDAFLDDPAGLGDDVRKGMLEHFTEEEIVECALFLASAFSKLFVVLGLEPPEMATTVLPLALLRGEAG
jgi:hypothetical protein